MYKILIVEDEHLIRKWLHYAIDYAALDMTVVGEAANGKIGIKEIQRLAPDIVLSDITMPEADAFTMFAATENQSYVKLILSGYNDFANAKKALQAGVSDFITKPIDPKELFAVLEQVKLKLDKAKNAKQLSQISNLTNDLNYLSSLKLVTDPCTKAVIEWVKKNLTSTATVAEIGNQLGYSESYIYKRFKETSGVTLNQFRTDFRLQKAVELLMADLNLHVYELAEAVGIKDYAYFNRIFKKHLGFTVSELKEQLKANAKA